MFLKYKNSLCERNIVGTEDTGVAFHLQCGLANEHLDCCVHILNCTAQGTRNFLGRCRCLNADFVDGVLDKAAGHSNSCARGRSSVTISCGLKLRNILVEVKFLTPSWIKTKEMVPRTLLI